MTNTRKDFLQRVSATIAKHCLLPPASSKGAGIVLVALSGGADSVALLRCLLELGYKCEAAHCNFHLRGKEADRDEEFCSELCHHLGVRLHRRYCDTRGYSDKHKVSIEMAARELRYDFFHQLAEENRLEATAVAHHRDDNAETILLNIVRGTGLRGLAGMPYKNDTIVRPLLDMSKQEILDYLRELGQDFITDSTNLVADVKRNVVRLKVLPLLRELNPSIEDTLLENAAIARDAQRLISHEATYIKKIKNTDGSVSIHKTGVKERVLLFELLHPLGFTPEQVTEIWQQRDAQPGAIWRSASHELLRDREDFIVRKCERRKVQEIESTKVAASEVGEISRNPQIAMLDADKVGEHLEVRPVKQGDSFVPYGMKGRKLVSRFLIDCKMSAFEKERQLVATNGKNIVWLVGHRTDDRYKVTAETKNILILKAKD